MPRCVVIRNPASRRALSEERLQAALDHARAAGWHVERVETDYQHHGMEIARAAAAAGVDVVVVNGGDGTINEVIQGIAHTDTALAVLPGGTANVWANEAGIHKDPSDAMLDIVRGVRRRIDLGRAGERYFLLMAGVGLDAEIVPRVGARMKRLLGAASYVVSGAFIALRTKPRQVAMRIDGAAADASVYWMLISNTRSYGGLAEITYRAVADDGLLDVEVMHRGGVFHLLADGVRLLFHRHDRSPNVEYRHARTVEIATAGLPVQVDGEFLGATPMRFEVAPAALTVIVPPSLRSALFQQPAIGPVDAAARE
ncbi:MAG: diacylglycerol kinase family lipid kinase [Chloroflexi bacterium]|nr:diacylglycerol kinase family lipid kinase [Chloroflexota bacterium]